MRRLALALLLVAAGCATAATDAPGPLVAVAASLHQVTRSIAEQFRSTHGVTVRLSAGASGNLSRQILRGAPYEIFISADGSYARRVAASGVVRGDARVLAHGRLALYLPARSPVDLPAPGDGLAARLARTLEAPDVARLAMANPEHAPYGRAAREVLQLIGSWERLRGRIVLGESVAQAARFAGGADVQAALLPLSLVLRSPALAERGRHLALPNAWHAPLEHTMVLLTRGGDAAAAFFRYLSGEQARQMLRDAGFVAPPVGS